MGTARVAAVVALGALVACNGGAEPVFDRDDLARLVMQEGDAPKGTTFVPSSSGTRTLEEYSEDVTEERALRAAGFVEAYQAFFLSPGALSGRDPSGSLAVSIAIVFRDLDGARAGLAAVEEDVRNDGAGLTDRPTPGLGDDAFGVYGDLEPGRPPGYLFAWRVGNAVLALVAAGARGAINERSVLVLVDAIDARARASA